MSDVTRFVNPPITGLQFARQLAYIVREISHWTGDALTPFPNEPMSKDAIHQFTAMIRERLDRIEQWEEELPLF